MTNHYELLYLVSAQFTEEELEPIKNDVKKIIAKFQGRITLEDSLGKKKLAYPIKKIMQAYYILYELDLEGINLKKLNEELKLEPKILRHLITKKSAYSPSFVQRTQVLMEEKPVLEKKEDKLREEKQKKVKIEDLDKKLDVLLEGDIL